MIPYIIILLLLLIAVFLVNKETEKKLVLASCFIMFVLGTFRGFTVGTDVQHYYYNYIHTNFQSSTWNAITPFEPGFNYFIAFWRIYIYDDYLSFVGALFFITNLLMLFFLRKESKRFSVAVLVFFLLGMFQSSMNTMRQWFALSLALPFVFAYLQTQSIHKKCLCVLMIVVVGSLFHRSVVILALLPIVERASKVDLGRVTIIAVIIGSYIFSFIRREVLEVIAPFFDLFIERYVSYVLEGEEQSGNRALLQTFLISYIVYWKYKKEDIILLLAVLGVIVFNLASSLSAAGGRLASPFMFFLSVFLANTFERKKWSAYNIIVMLSLCILYFDGYVIKNAGETIPYSFRTF